MEVILRESVPNVGRAGEIVVVKNGYARNYLLPLHWLVEGFVQT